MKIFKTFYESKIDKSNKHFIFKQNVNNMLIIIIDGIKFYMQFKYNKDIFNYYYQFIPITGDDLDKVNNDKQKFIKIIEKLINKKINLSFIFNDLKLPGLTFVSKNESAINDYMCNKLK